MELSGKKIIVSRAINDPSRICVNSDEILGNKHEYTNKEWKKILGEQLFLIPRIERTEYKPTYRSLVGFFMRKNKDAYENPFKTFARERAYQTQINNAYLLGLHWENASDAQLLKEETRKNNDLIKLLKSNGMESSIASLENRAAVLKGQIEQKEKEISEFKVHDEYSAIQNKADKLTSLMKNIFRENYLLRSKFTLYKKAVAEESISEQWSVSDVYKDIGINFEGKAKKTLDETKVFHKQLVLNRQKFLETEIQEIKNKIKINNENHKKHDEERSKLLKILNTHGALEDYHHLQKSFENIRIEFLDVKKWIEKSRL